MATKLRVLLVEDSEDDAQLIGRELVRGGFDVEPERIETLEALEHALGEGSWDLILSDHAMPGFDSLAALEIVKRRAPSVPVVLVSGAIGEQAAVEVMRAGAVDYVSKQHLERLEPVVLRTLRDARIERERARAEERFHSAFDNAPTGMAVVGCADGDAGRLLQVNDAFRRIVGRTDEELLGQFLDPFTHPDDVVHERLIVRRVLAGEPVASRIEKRFVRPDGVEVPVLVHISVVHEPDGSNRHLIEQVEDLTELRRFEGEVEYLTGHDVLTGLVNRSRFTAELEAQLARSRQSGASGAVLLMDVDDFQHVNDAFGPGDGDLVLRAVGRILSEEARTGETVARIGGDGFAVLLPFASPARAKATAERLLAAVAAARHTLGDSSTHVTLSAGIAPFDGQQDWLRWSEVMMCGGLALNVAKAKGRNHAVVFDFGSVETTQAQERATWYDRIRDGLESAAFELWAQPIVSVRSGETAACELLLRMRDDDGALIGPDTFLPAAEHFNLMPAVDQWVLREATALAQLYGTDGFSLALNLGAASIGDRSTPGRIEAFLDQSGLDPARVTFEVTETAAIRNMEEAVIFARFLKDLGCSLALDDFGSGFSSFYYLKHLPCDFLKIDGGFVRNLPYDSIDRVIVRSIVEAARGLGRTTVAEWVEDAETLKLLGELGVDFAQGFHLGRPAPAAKVLSAAGAHG